LRKTSEQAADDLVLASNVAPPDYAEHLVGIAAQMRGFRLFGHVALPMAGRSDLEGRVRAILDPRQNRGSLTRTSCYALVALAMLLVVPCALLRLGYAESKAVEKHPANAEGAAKAATTPMRFELTILGPDKQPVPRCAVEVRSDVLPTAASVQRGTFTKKSGNGAFLQADAAGSLVLDLPQEPMTFEVCIEQPGYGPYWAQWRSTEHREPVPARFVAELDAAWSVGGIVVDRQGKPIAGATVWPSVEFKKRPGDADELHFGKRLSTDAEGKWRFDSVPVSMKEVLVEIDHPGFQPNDAALPRGTFEIRPRGQPAAKIELQPGLTVAGKVTDEAGKPIAGALVRTRFCNHDREATTNISGDYQLTGCEPKMARIVVSAKGRALDLKEVLLAPDMGPLDFKTQPGGKIRVRVLDEKGNPAARACICVRELHGMWDCFAFDHIVRYADAGGVWQWDEAPLDEFKADICPPGGMQLQTQRLIARDEEYVFRTHPRLVISGSVVDAETRQPAKAFRVVPGVRADARAGRPGPARIDWSREDGYAANDGKYRIERDREETAHLVRIEADGYRVAVSRDIKSDEGKAHVDFALVKAQDVAAQILTPDGRPAAGAKIVIGIAAAQIVVKNGRIDRQTLAPQCEADESGRFQFPAQDGPYQLVIVHPAGFALRKSAEQEIPGTVTLTAWARVEGTFRVGAKTVSAALVDIQTNEIDSSGDGAPHIFTEHEATTGPDGRFVFERVFPGQGFIGRGVRLMADEGAAEVTSAVQIAAEFPAGKTTHIDLGGFGRQVLGKLAGPAGSHEKVLWQFARIDADADLPAPKMPAVPADVQGDPAREKAWWTAWKATAEGKAWLAEHEKYDKLCRASPNLFAKPDRDGAFRIDDVPPGSYVLSVDFDEHRAGRLSNYRFTVPPTAGNRTSEALDLGTLTLEKYQ
jgi:protocatechuate 3,4-dioxygenase beta subunit